MTRSLFPSVHKLDQKKGTCFLSGETNLLLNIMKDVSRYVDMQKYGSADLFKRVVRGMKEGDCVLKSHFDEVN